MTKPLSSAAQAVLDGFRAVPNLMDGPSIAGALRAAAGCVPKETWGGENYATGFRDGIAFGCQFLHELAAELEGGDD